MKNTQNKRRYAVRFMKWTGIFNTRLTPRYYSNYEAALCYGDSRSGVGREYATFQIIEV